MAGKKINQLEQISQLSNESVLPIVYVESGTADSTATKVTVGQLKSDITSNTYTKSEVDTKLSIKQNVLTAGQNITIAEDSDEQLVISATSGSSLPDQTGQSGKFLTTDGTDASWSTISALQNTATGTSSLTINGTSTSQPYSVNIGTSSQVVTENSVAIGHAATTVNIVNRGAIAIGKDAKANGGCVAIGENATTVDPSYPSQGKIGGVAIGYTAQAQGNYCTAIGYSATAEVNNTIQIGYGTNSTADSLSVGFIKNIPGQGDVANNYTLLDGNTGKVPMARLPIEPVTQAEYDALVSGGTVDANTLYLIKPAS